MNQPETNQKKLALVLVEDNPGDVCLIRRALDAQGLSYDLTVASDGEEAIAYVAKCEAASEAIDLVLLDLNLPRRRGSEVLEWIRNSSSFENVPTLLLTSSDSAQDRERCLRLGASAYVRKPSNLAEFMLIGNMVKDLTGSAARDTIGPGGNDGRIGSGSSSDRPGDPSIRCVGAGRTGGISEDPAKGG